MVSSMIAYFTISAFNIRCDSCLTSSTLSDLTNSKITMFNLTKVTFTPRGSPKKLGLEVRLTLG